MHTQGMAWFHCSNRNAMLSGNYRVSPIFQQPRQRTPEMHKVGTEIIPAFTHLHAGIHDFLLPACWCLIYLADNSGKPFYRRQNLFPPVVSHRSLGSIAAFLAHQKIHTSAHFMDTSHINTHLHITSISPGHHMVWHREIQAVLNR